MVAMQEYREYHLYSPIHKQAETWQVRKF